jgi:hypothetical protein
LAKRLLVLSAGLGPTNNLIRSLRAGDPSLWIVGSHSDRFYLCKSPADRNYLVPRAADAGFVDALLRIIDAEKIDLLVPDTDPDVRAISELRDAFSRRLFLPRREVIEICQDKLALTTLLRARDVPAPLTYPVTELDEIGDLFHRLGPCSRLWCRVREGSGAFAAIPVTRPEQARSWISYWEEMRGVPATSFTLSEYLPGRDFSLQCLWKQGTLLLAKMSERLSYLGGASQPSGQSSTPALAKTVFEPRAFEVCRSAIRALDPEASGIFCFDLKENAVGTPCVTEINAGRFAMITNIYDLVGKHNMALTYVRAAFDEPVEIVAEQDFVEDCYLVRDLDTVPDVFDADQLFERVLEVPTPDEPVARRLSE